MEKAALFKDELGEGSLVEDKERGMRGKRVKERRCNWRVGEGVVLEERRRGVVSLKMEDGGGRGRMDRGEREIEICRR